MNWHWQEKLVLPVPHLRCNFHFSRKKWTLLSFIIKVRIGSIFVHCIHLFLGEYRYEKVPIPEPGPKEILVKVLAVGICAGDGKVLDGAERFWGKPGESLF